MKKCHFYPRPGLAFGYCRCLRLSCGHQSRACPRDNWWLVPARITKFELDMQNILVKIPIVLGVDWPWSSRSNFTWKSKFTLFWACPHDTRHKLKLGFPNFDQKCILVLLRSLLILGLIGLDLQFHFQFWNPFFYQIYLCCFCKYLVWPSVMYLVKHHWRPISFHGYWLYISFAVNHRWTFRSIIDIAIDSIHIGGLIFSVNHSGALCLQSPSTSGSARMRDTLPCAWQGISKHQNTVEFRRNCRQGSTLRVVRSSDPT